MDKVKNVSKAVFRQTHFYLELIKVDYKRQSEREQEIDPRLTKGHLLMTTTFATVTCIK